jgi:hypothetical protein
MSISTATLDKTMSYHMHYLYKVVGQSPLEAGKRFLENFQRWLPIIAPRRLHELIELSERGLPGADVSVLLLSICLVTMRSGGDLAGPFVHHTAVHVAVKTLYAQVQASMHANTALVRAGVIISAYEYASGQIDSASISIAACIRMAQVIGIGIAYDRLGAVQEETRLQAMADWNLWWSIIVLERFDPYPTSGHYVNGNMQRPDMFQIYLARMQPCQTPKSGGSLPRYRCAFTFRR